LKHITTKQDMIKLADFVKIPIHLKPVSESDTTKQTLPTDILKP